jgi:glutaminase
MNYRRRRIQIAILVLLVPIALSNTATSQNKSPVAPTEQAFNAILKQAYENFKDDTTGKNADYIPALAQVDSKLYGIAIITTDGRIYKIGDVDKAFSIQSISKVFTLALAMEELGAEEVFKKVGSEPTGRPFNSIPAVVEMPTHAGNPYVNAGAIATASLISGGADEKWNKLLTFYSKAAGTKPFRCCWRSTTAFTPIRLSPSMSTRRRARSGLQLINLRLWERRFRTTARTR